MHAGSARARARAMPSIWNMAAATSAPITCAPAPLRPPHAHRCCRCTACRAQRSNRARPKPALGSRGGANLAQGGGGRDGRVAVRQLMRREEERGVIEGACARPKPVKFCFTLQAARRALAALKNPIACHAPISVRNTAAGQPAGSACFGAEPALGEGGAPGKVPAQPHPARQTHSPWLPSTDVATSASSRMVEETNAYTRCVRTHLLRPAPGGSAGGKTPSGS